MGLQRVRITTENNVFLHMNMAALDVHNWPDAHITLR